MTKRRRRNDEKDQRDNLPDGVLTLDPASKANSGLAYRSIGKVWTPHTKQLRCPEWYFSGSIWSSVMHDDLARMIAATVPRGGRVVYAATATAYFGNGLAMGRAIGAIEGMLHDLNVFPDGDTVWEIQDSTWRYREYTLEDRTKIKEIKDTKERRMALKAMAVATVYARYKIEVDDNAAEAILLNDYVQRKLDGEPEGAPR